MKVMRIVLCFCAISVLTMAAVSAQNGAVVVRGEYLWGGYEWDGYSTLVIQSSDSEFFCLVEPGDLMWVDWIEVTRPGGTVAYQERAHYFTRVFYPATEDDFWADPCALWNNGDLLVAEGITHSTWTDNSAFWGANGHSNRQNVWGYTIAGTLYDYAGLCEDGMVDVNAVRKWKLDKNFQNSDFPACLPDCQIVQVAKGPRLSCPD